MALTVNLMPSGHKCTHRRRKNAPTLRRVVRTYVTGGALWEVAGSGALPPDSKYRICIPHAEFESVNGCKKMD